MNRQKVMEAMARLETASDALFYKALAVVGAEKAAAKAAAGQAACAEAADAAKEALRVAFSAYEITEALQETRDVLMDVWNDHLFAASADAASPSNNAEGAHAPEPSHSGVSASKSWPKLLPISRQLLHCASPAEAPNLSPAEAPNLSPAPTPREQSRRRSVARGAACGRKRVSSCSREDSSRSDSCSTCSESSSSDESFFDSCSTCSDSTGSDVSDKE